VAVLGVGVMGRRHVRVFAQMPDAYELAGVFDADRQVAEEVAGPWRVPVFADARAGVAAADLVVIASPIEAHAEGAMCALKLRRDVLVEKPLCARVDDAFALVRIAAGSSASLFVGHSERFNPVVVALRRLVRAHEVHAISIRRATPALMAPREGDVLLSLGVHDVDLGAYLTDSLVSLRDVSATPSGDNQDRAELSLVAATGAVIRVTADRAASRRERTIEVVTRAEVFEGDLLAPRLVWRPRSGGATTEVEIVSIEPLVEQAGALRDALEGVGPSRVATGADGAQALALVVEARRRLQGGWAPDPRVSEAS